MAALREAVDAGEPVLIGYVDNHGTRTERLVHPTAVEGGQLFVAGPPVVAAAMGEALSRAGVTAGGSWAGGALGVAFCEAVFGVTGVGLVGCLFVGGAGGGYIGDQVGEEVFD